MKSFRTEFPPFRSAVSLAYGQPILSIGSCFAEHIGQRLQRRKFSLHLNPFGILYNPLSIARCLEQLLQGDPFSEEDWIFQGGLWHSLSHHGRFSCPEREALIHSVRESAARSRDFLQKTDRLLITLGTAFVYEYLPRQRVVANCHKLPAADFRKYRLSEAEASAALESVLLLLKAAQPTLEVILTVSPVRHLRDGFVENQRSKAVLLLAADRLAAAHDFIYYFPAYELVLDDLRDYRFFGEDLVHPNEQAVEYVWTYFQQAFFDEATREVVRKVERLLAAAAHRPFVASTPEHQAFVENQLLAIRTLEAQYPFLDLEAEKRHFLAQQL